MHLRELAELHYSLTLKCKGLHSFSHHLDQQKQQVLKKQLACEFHVRKKVKQCWLVWVRMCENNEEASLGSLSLKARHHAASKLTHKALAVWVKYVLHQRCKKSLKSRADAFFRENALPRLEGYVLSRNDNHVTPNTIV